MLYAAKNIPQILVILVALILRTSCAWGLPAEAPATEGDSTAKYMDPWEGVSISDAYDCGKCRRCGKKNELRAATYPRCGYELPQPSLEITDPDMVFLPGKGYCREGTLLEPAKARKDFIITGYALLAVAGVSLIVGAIFPSDEEGINVLGIVSACIGGSFLILEYTIRRGSVYALSTWLADNSGRGYAYARPSPNSVDVTFKAEVGRSDFKEGGYR